MLRECLFRTRHVVGGGDKISESAEVTPTAAAQSQKAMCCACVTGSAQCAVTGVQGTFKAFLLCNSNMWVKASRIIQDFVET